jgi:hypothetical protein
MTPLLMRDLFRFSEFLGLYVMPGLTVVWVLALACWIGQKVRTLPKTYASAPARMEAKDDWQTVVLMVQEPATSNN